MKLSGSSKTPASLPKTSTPGASLPHLALVSVTVNLCRSVPASGSCKLSGTPAYSAVFRTSSLSVARTGATSFFMLTPACLHPGRRQKCSLLSLYPLCTVNQTTTCALLHLSTLVQVLGRLRSAC